MSTASALKVRLTCIRLDFHAGSVLAMEKPRPIGSPSSYPAALGLEYHLIASRSRHCLHRLVNLFQRKAMRDNALGIH